MATKKQQEDAPEDNGASSNQETANQNAAAIEVLTDANAKLVEANQALELANSNLTGANLKLTEANEQLSTANKSLQEANTNLEATNEKLVEANTSLTDANEKLVEANTTLTDANEILEEAKVAAAEEGSKKPLSSLGVNKAVNTKPVIPEDAVEVKYKRNGKEVTGNFKMLVPTIQVHEKKLTAEECLKDAEAMQFLVEETFKNGKSPFVLEVHE